MAEQRQSPDQEVLTIREKLRTISDELRKIEQEGKKKIAWAHQLYREYIRAVDEKNDEQQRLLCKQANTWLRDQRTSIVSILNPTRPEYNDSLFRDVISLAKEEPYSVACTRKSLMKTRRGLLCRVDALLKQRRALRQTIRVNQPVSPAVVAAARELGRICTPRKAAASRKNGQNYGGRPRLPRCPICEEKDRQCRKCRSMPNATLQ